ncbi:MAG: three-Cys-motif partner protein TcmP [Longimicrobiales bacterium]
MTKGGKDHFELFEDHTLLKHLILDKYLKRWAAKLLSGWSEIWFVDAFAGEGSDHQGNPGSPLIAAKVAEGALRAHGPNAQGRSPMRVLAIELDTVRFGRLQSVMRPFVEAAPRIAHVANGTLHTWVDQLVARSEDKPVLYFIDPFGVDTDVWQDLQKLLSGPHDEVFALFSDVGAKRLYSVLLSEDRDVEYEVGQVLAAPSLFEHMTVEDAEAKRVEAEAANRARRSTQPSAERILTEALGADSIEQLAAVPKDEQRAAAARLFMNRLRQAGAKYVISLPVRDTDNARVYQLVHASKAKAAVQAMKQAMSEALNSSSLPDGVKASIQAELHLEVGEVVREIARRFSGQEVLWTDGKDRGDSETVRRFLLEDTPAFPWQLRSVKEGLADHAYQIRARKTAFRFP